MNFSLIRHFGWYWCLSKRLKCNRLRNKCQALTISFILSKQRNSSLKCCFYCPEKRVEGEESIPSHHDAPPPNWAKSEKFQIDENSRNFAPPPPSWGCILPPSPRSDWDSKLSIRSHYLHFFCRWELFHNGERMTGNYSCSFDISWC